MKKKVTLTIDEELIPRAKKLASSKNLSLSQLVEDLLQAADSSRKETFTERWMGKFEPAEIEGDDRYEYLAAKYLKR